MSLESPFSKNPAATSNERAPGKVAIDRSVYTTEKVLPNAEWRIAEEDERAKALTAIDPSEIQLVDELTGEEKSMEGEELLKRLKESSAIRLDAGVLQMFLDAQELIPQEWQKDRVEGQRMPTQVFFDGSVVVGRAGKRYAMGMQYYTGKWHKVFRRLENHRSGFRVSAVLNQNR